MELGDLALRVQIGAALAREGLDEALHLLEVARVGLRAVIVGDGVERVGVAVGL